MLVTGERFCELCQRSGYVPLPIGKRHVLHLAALSRTDGAKPHKDPFDRILVCQAAEENIKLVTHDSLIVGYDEPCILFVRLLRLALGL